MDVNSGLPVVLTIFTFFMTLVIPAVVVVGIILIVQHAKKSATARTRALEGYARQRGWAFAQSAPGIVPRFGNAPPFKQGSARVFSNFMGFSTGRYFGHSFDYQYTIQGDKSSETYYFHVVALELPVALPRLEVRPEGLMRGIVEFFGVRDLQFESDEFNRAWNVQASNASFAHEVINPQMIEWLMADQQRLANFTIDRNTLYTAVSQKQDPNRIDGLVWYLTQFLDRIPAFVWDKARGL